MYKLNCKHLFKSMKEMKEKSDNEVKRIKNEMLEKRRKRIEENKEEEKIYNEFRDKCVDVFINDLLNIISIENVKNYLEYSRGDDTYFIKSVVVHRTVDEKIENRRYYREQIYSTPINTLNDVFCIIDIFRRNGFRIGDKLKQDIENKFNNKIKEIEIKLQYDFLTAKEFGILVYIKKSSFLRKLFIKRKQIPFNSVV